MTRRQFDDMKREINKSSNIIWDDTDDYRNAFYASDAIITDGTTFCLEYLYTKKPILLTPRNMNGFYLFEDMLSSYYIGKKIQDIKIILLSNIYILFFKNFEYFLLNY